MAIDWILVITYITTIILFLGTPGPVTVMVVNTSIKHGISAGLKTIAGTNCASLVLIACSMAVIQGVLAISQSAMLWLTLFGSLYLLYFALRILKEQMSEHKHLDVSTSSYNKGFVDGLIVGLSNPKDILFFVAFFPMFFNISQNKWLATVMLVGIWIVLDYLILSIYAVLFTKITNHKITSIINYLSGLVLLIVAVYASIMTSIKLYFGEKLVNY
ncbi:hypothetical protein B0681_07415 [Moraxella porci DSM 25326]|uniref:Lysine transporter LysE n=1 Tax=Moraxella porci DSM 25326 TaxID=573983 RepID=A0A1T0CPU7_9GAMM|nr:LysE family translocator [Moraxella porci]OOS24333.1 hypothetical protein B0681_07415 [Moraxella porci DSM 25326]